MFDEYPNHNSDEPHCTISAFLHRIAFTVLHASHHIERAECCSVLFCLVYSFYYDLVKWVPLTMKYFVQVLLMNEVDIYRERERFEAPIKFEFVAFVQLICSFESLNHK